MPAGAALAAVALYINIVDVVGFCRGAARTINALTRVIFDKCGAGICMRCDLTLPTPRQHTTTKTHHVSSD